ncbi:MAG: hypothetical protein P8Y12_11030 [Gammaproteobacteria bacterium]|jgi:DUF438 domain-containing protein
MHRETAHPLNSEYEHWHAVTSLRYQQFLESITALELDDAERHLHVFSKLLKAIVNFSDIRLDDLMQGSDQSFELVKADHLIISRTLNLVDNALANLKTISEKNPETLRTELVYRLDVMVRLNNILSKHQLRQIELLFPLFEAKLNQQEANSLANQMTETMQRANPN